MVAKSISHQETLVSEGSTVNTNEQNGFPHGFISWRVWISQPTALSFGPQVPRKPTFDAFLSVRVSSRPRDKAGVENKRSGKHGTIAWKRKRWMILPPNGQSWPMVILGPEILINSQLSVEVTERLPVFLSPCPHIALDPGADVLI